MWSTSGCFTSWPVPCRPGDGYADDLREFISRRLDKVNPYESKEYCLQQEKASRLFEEIKRMLPEEGRALLVAYSDALGAAHCLEMAMPGERAFLDGMRIVLRALEAEGEEKSTLTISDADSNTELTGQISCATA